MPKYYVESGSLRQIVDADGPLEAAGKAIRLAIKGGDSLNLCEGIVVSERGFPHISPDDWILTTHEVLKISALIDEFNYDP